VLAICLIIAIIVALNRGNLADAGPAVAVAVVLHNATGLAAGYLCARLLGIAEREARTLAIEVGMQNSGLAVALAIKFFAPVAALPGALFSVWHNVSGSLLASFWARRSAGLRPEGAR
jgi:BASS family bile acid:Na+ symporter